MDLELYIQIVDGHPQDHPITADNLKLAFPDVDINNLPADRFAKFVRAPFPRLRVFEVHEGVSYQWVDGVVTDVHSVRSMTDEERAAKIAELQEASEIARQRRIGFLNEKLAEETDEAVIAGLSSSLSEHHNWELRSFDPPSPLPFLPYKDKDGNWVFP